jgi:hypothetical protein
MKVKQEEHVISSTLIVTCLLGLLVANDQRQQQKPAYSATHGPQATATTTAPKAGQLSGRAKSKRKKHLFHSKLLQRRNNDFTI